MESAVQYGTATVRPRLTVVRDGSIDGPFSALPHAIIRRTDVSRHARLLVAVLQMYGWQGSDITATHETLAADMGCSTRMLRTYLTELMDAGIVTEHEAGFRRQKVYRLVSIGSTLPIETVNEKPASDSTAVNRKFPAVQSEISGHSNRNEDSDSYKKTPEKKTKQEELPPTGVGAADAAEPATEKPAKANSKKKTACPDTFPLEAKHFDYGAELGLGADRVRAETDKFLAHHRFKGTLGLDWYAGWQNWMRRAVTYDAPKPAAPPARNGSDRMLPGAASKQSSKWTDPEVMKQWRGKVGGVSTEARDGR